MTIHPITKASQTGRSQLKAGARIARKAASESKKKAKAQLRGELSPRWKADIIARDNGICMLCLKPCTKEDPAVVDHVRPAAQFPRTCESNLATLHESCNQGKGARTDAIPTILRNIGTSIAIVGGPDELPPVRKPIERNPARYDNVVEKLSALVGKRVPK